MRSHLNQYVFSPLFWIMSLLLLTLFLLVALLFTPYGPKTVAFLADSSLKELSIKGVSGSVLSGLSVDEFFLDSATGIEIKDIKLNVDKYDLQNKKIFADTLSVGELVSDETQTLLFQIKGIVLKNASINDGKLTFESLAGQPTILDQPLKIDVAKGSLNMNQPHDVSTSGGISFDHPELGSLKGEIQVGGTLTEYILGTDLEFNQKEIGSGTLSVKGEGDYKKVELSELKISSNHGKAEATGKVEWDPEIRLNFDIDGKDLETKAFRFY